MSETRFIVEESYPGGHEIRHNYYGPATEAEFRAGTPTQDEGSRQTGDPFQDVLAFLDTAGVDSNGTRFLTTEEQLDMLFRDGELYCIDGVTLTLRVVRDWVVHIETVLQADESNHRVYGPYTKEQADEQFDHLVHGPEFSSEITGVHVLRMEKP